MITDGVRVVSDPFDTTGFRISMEQGIKALAELTAILDRTNWTSLASFDWQAMRRERLRVSAMHTEYHRRRRARARRARR